MTYNTKNKVLNYNGKVYFSDRYANNIKRANLDGTDVEIVVKDTEYPVDLAIDFKSR